MMSTLREKRFIQVILWCVLVAFISIIFLSWGMNYYGPQEDDSNVVAKVGGEKITYKELHDLADQQTYGQDGPSDPKEIDRIRRQVLDRLIDSAVLRESAKKMGVHVPVEEVAASIQQSPYFMDANRRFNPVTYLSLLAQNNMTAAQFEDSQRQQILVSKVQSILSDSVLYTPEELESFAHFLNRELKARYLVLDAEEIESSLSYTEDDLRRHYEDRRQEYDKAERAKLSHILLSLSEKATPEEEEVLKKKLEEYRAEILSGKSKFEDLARKYSQDTASKDKGGAMDWMDRDRFDPDFAAGAFKLKKGAVSGPVKSRYGYHLIRMNDYAKAHQSKFSEVRDKVLKSFKQEKVSENLNRLSSQVNRRLEAGEDLKALAASLKLETRTTPWFNRDKGIPDMKDAKYAADTMAEKHPGDWHGPVYLGKNRAFFQITEERERPMDPEKLGKARGEVEKRLANFKRGIWLKQFLAEQRKKLRIKIHLQEPTA